jgi:nucleotide-binding universal stress UspA family protein
VVSTALDLLRHAPYPLLVVPTLGWGTRSPQRLLLAVDGEPFELGTHTGMLRRLQRATGGTLDVVHVTDDAHARPETSAVLRTIRQNNLLADVPPGRLHQVYNPSVADGVLQEAARLGADLLVVVARPHSLLGSLFHHSVTAQLLQESPIPVLLLPTETEA